jgi:hypothetical protein
MNKSSKNLAYPSHLYISQFTKHFQEGFSLSKKTAFSK